MRKLILLVAASAFLMQAKAQQVIEVKTVPPPVMTTFQTSYPNVQPVTWHRVGNIYIADYSANTTPMYVSYDASGRLVETGEGVSVSTVPPAMSAYWKDNYKDAKMETVYKVKDDKGKIKYKSKVKGEDVWFDENGNYVRMDDGKTKMKMEKEAKDD